MLRNRQFANIVQQRRRMQRFQFSSFYAQFFCHLNGIDPHPLQMVVSSLIFSFDCERKCLNSSKMQVGHLLYMSFLIFQLPEI